MLIDLAIADIQARNPSVDHLSNGWMLRLNRSSPESNNIMQSYSNNKSQQTVVGVSVGVTAVAVILMLITIGTIFGIKKRFSL